MTSGQDSFFFGNIFVDMSVFHFKWFDVRNERSAMKVNTDGVLLGAVTDVFPEDRSVLDVGTGTGTVALMVAQRLDGRRPERDWRVRGIDIDAPSAEEAAWNFRMSPWNGVLEAENVGLLAFRNSARGETFDLIVSNPPYYDNSLQAPDPRRNSARHTGGTETFDGAEPLSYRDILEYASEALSEFGRVSMILPSDQEKALLRYARMCGFAPWKILRIKTVERKPVSRLIVQFKRRAHCVDSVTEERLTLLDEKGRRTSQHASLVTDYCL